MRLGPRAVTCRQVLHLVESDVTEPHGLGVAPSLAAAPCVNDTRHRHKEGACAVGAGLGFR